MKLNSLQLTLGLTASLFLAGPIGAQFTRLPHHSTANAPVPAVSGGHGSNVQALEDWNGDGYADYGVGASGFEVSPGLLAGRVYVYSGRDATLIQSFDGDQIGKDFGVRLGDVGDVTGDGVRDMAIAAPKYDTGFGNVGAVFLYNGATGARVWTFGGDVDSKNVGVDLGVIADVTGDGRRDLVVSDSGWGAGSSGLGRIHFVNGATGGLIGTVTGDVFFTSFGHRLATRPDAGSTVFTTDRKGNVFSVGLPVGGIGTKPLFQPAPVGATTESPDIALIQAPAGGFRLLIGRALGDTDGFVNNGTVELTGLVDPTPILTIKGTSDGEAVGGLVNAMKDLNGDGDEEIGYRSNAPGFNIRLRTATQSGVQVDDLQMPGSGTFSDDDSIPDTTGDGRGEILGGHGNSGRAYLFGVGLELTSQGSAGGGLQASFDMDCAAVNGGRFYVQFYSLAGASPGTVGAPGWPLLPLNFDAVTLAALNLAGSPVFPGAVGFLSPTGTASSSMDIDAGTVASISPLDITTAVAVLGPGGVVHTTNPVEIDVP